MTFQQTHFLFRSLNFHGIRHPDIANVLPIYGYAIGYLVEVKAEILDPYTFVHILFPSRSY